MADGASLTVLNNQSLRRFEAHLGDRLVGIAQYRLQSGRIIFVHTEVDRSAEGQGVGRRLAAEGLEHARDVKLRVIAQCPFIADFINEHAEYQDLLLPANG
jgi:uncharacterized protein